MNRFSTWIRLNHTHFLSCQDITYRNPHEPVTYPNDWWMGARVLVAQCVVILIERCVGVLVSKDEVWAKWQGTWCSGKSIRFHFMNHLMSLFARWRQTTEATKATERPRTTTGSLRRRWARIFVSSWVNLRFWSDEKKPTLWVPRCRPACRGASLYYCYRHDQLLVSRTVGLCQPLRVSWRLASCCIISSSVFLLNSSDWGGTDLPYGLSSSCSGGEGVGGDSVCVCVSLLEASSQSEGLRVREWCILPYEAI